MGAPLYPTLFNIVVDAVIRHWITVGVSKEAGPDGFGSVVKRMETFSYTDNGILASVRPK